MLKRLGLSVAVARGGRSAAPRQEVAQGERGCDHYQRAEDNSDIGEEQTASHGDHPFQSCHEEEAFLILQPGRAVSDFSLRACSTNVRGSLATVLMDLPTSLMCHLP